MKKFTSLICFSLSVVVLNIPIASASDKLCEAKFKLKMIYQAAIGSQRGQRVVEETSIDLTRRELLADPQAQNMAPTMLAVSLVNAMRQAIWSQTNQEEPHGSLLADTSSATVLSPGSYRIGEIPLIPSITDKAKGEEKNTLNQRIAAALRSTVDEIEEAARFTNSAEGRAEDGVAKIIFEPAFIEAIEKARKLADNIESAREWQYGPVLRRGGSAVLHGGGMRSMTRGGGALESFGGGAASLGAAQSKGFDVTTGGQMDWGHAQELIDQGRIPTLDQLPVTAFLKEFHLSLPRGEGKALIRPLLGATYHAPSNRLFVQVSQTSDVKPESYKRPPVNLAVALDVSGSMTVKDNTPKTRMEWARETLDKIFRSNKLTKDDFITLITFSDSAQVVSASVRATPENLEQLASQASITESSYSTTNIREALELAAEKLDTIEENLYSEGSEASIAQADGMEKRILLVSDIQNSEWGRGSSSNRDTAAFARSLASRKISITALGIGTGFEGDFARALVDHMQGSTMVTVNSGKDLKNLVNEQFALLMAPVAVDVKMLGLFEGVPDDRKPKLVATYGIPTSDGEVEGSGTLMKISDLFFVQRGAQSGGGGAMLLEYDLTALVEGPRAQQDDASAADEDSQDQTSSGGSFDL